MKESSNDAYYDKWLKNNLKLVATASWQKKDIFRNNFSFNLPSIVQLSNNVEIEPYYLQRCTQNAFFNLPLIIFCYTCRFASLK